MAHRWSIGTLAAGFALVILAASATAATPARTPTTQTFTHSALGLSFTLPSDWVGFWTKQDGVPRFDGNGPARVAKLQINTARSTLTLSAVVARVVQFERRQLKADPNAVVSQRPARVGSIAATTITVRYRGLWVDGVGEITHLVYAFKHDGAIFLFDYSAIGDWFSKNRQTFVASINSVRFANVA
jgi:hypothetical protein